jgi:hypothetical protein
MHLTSLQMGQLGDLLMQALNKQPDFKSIPVQWLLDCESERKVLQQDFLEVFGRHLERIQSVLDSMIYRDVWVEYQMTPKELLDSSGYKQYVDSNLLRTMPRLTKVRRMMRVRFFNVPNITKAAEVELAYQQHFLVPDPYGQICVNRVNRYFPEKYANSTFWGCNGKKANWLTFTSNASLTENAVRCFSGSDSLASSTWYAGINPATLQI